MTHTCEECYLQQSTTSLLCDEDGNKAKYRNLTVSSPWPASHWRQNHPLPDIPRKGYQPSNINADKMAEMLLPADLQKEYKTKSVPAKVTGDGYWTWPEGLFTDQVHM